MVTIINSVTSNIGTISSPGIGSGLDINSLVSKLMQVESQPLTTLQTKQASYQSQLSALGTLKGLVSTLQTTAQALGTGGSAFSAMAASVSDATVLSATAGTGATAGSYTIGVQQLAASQALEVAGTSNGYATNATFSGGTLSIAVGSGTAVPVTIADGSSLSSVAQAINSANAGVTATVINSGGTTPVNYLMLTSNTTGSAGTIGITVTQTGSGGTQNLTDFAYSGSDTSALTQVQAAKNAQLSINGISITRSSNVVTDAIPGLTLNLTKAGPVDANGNPTVSTQVTVSRDTSAATSAITAFVNAYNAAVNQLHSLSAYDPSTNTASVLTGDFAITTLENQLPQLVQTAVSGLSGGIGHLFDIGISLQKDGTLALNSTKLQAALNDPTKDVAGLFSSSATGNVGVANQFNTALNKVLGVNGVFDSETSSLNSIIQDLAQQETNWQARLTQIQNHYLQQFNALDSLVANMTTTSTYLTQQLAALTKSTTG